MHPATIDAANAMTAATFRVTSHWKAVWAVCRPNDEVRGHHWSESGERPATHLDIPRLSVTFRNRSQREPRSLGETVGAPTGDWSTHCCGHRHDNLLPWVRRNISCLPGRERPCGRWGRWTWWFEAQVETAFNLRVAPLLNDVCPAHASIHKCTLSVGLGEARVISTHC